MLFIIIKYLRRAVIFYSTPHNYARLFYTEDPVAGITQTGNNVGIFVQPLIRRGNVDIHTLLAIPPKYAVC